MSNNYDDEYEERPPIPAPQSLNRETVDPWFVLEDEESNSKLNSPEVKSVAKQVVSVVVSLALFGLLIYGGWTLWNMFMDIWGDKVL